MKVVESVMKMFSSSMMAFGEPIIKLLDNPYIAAGISLFLVLYGSLARPELPEFIKTLLKNDIFRLFYIFLLTYISDKNAEVALIVAIVFMVGMGLVADAELKEEFQEEEEEEEEEEEDEEEVGEEEDDEEDDEEEDDEEEVEVEVEEEVEDEE